MTTGSTTTSRTALPIHHKTMAILLMSLAGLRRRGLIWQKESAKDPGQSHPRRAQAEGEAARRRRTGSGDLLSGLTPLNPADPVLHVDREVVHQHGANVGDHAPAVLCGSAGELQVLRHVHAGA